MVMRLSIARLEVGLFHALEERLNLGRISFRDVIALDHPRLPRAQSWPTANISQVRIGLNSLCHAVSSQGDNGSAPAMTNEQSTMNNGSSSKFPPECLAGDQGFQVPRATAGMKSSIALGSKAIVRSSSALLYAVMSNCVTSSPS